MKIWYQSAARFSIDSRWQAYKHSLKKHISSLLSSKSTFSLNGIDSQTDEYQDQNNLDEYRRGQFTQNAILAESQGFKAFAIGCWKDYANAYIRKNTNIIVVSIAEASLHASLILGRRPGVIMPNARDESIVRENLTFYGIEPSKILFTTCIIEMDIVLDAFKNPAPFSDHLIPCANRLINEGADVIIVGHGVFNELLYNMETWNIGIVPILDSMAALIAAIELFKR